MAEITFLAPGSCQLEVTAQGTVGTDTGVDLASVSWTIEQALIAGCRFSPSAGDVHIDRNGVLTIGRSLFDRINQADGDDAIPGQCTLIIRADSTITKTVLDRFKVLVGYPGEGGGGGGGGAQTVDVTLWNNSATESLKQVMPERVRLLTGYDAQGAPIYGDPIQIEQVTTTFQDMTVYGVKISGVQAGSVIRPELPTGYEVDNVGISYAPTDVPFPPTYESVSRITVPRPLDGFVVTGMYSITSAS